MDNATNPGFFVFHRKRGEVKENIWYPKLNAKNLKRKPISRRGCFNARFL